MKKTLIMTAAIAGLALASQAASIAWQTSGQYIYGPDGVTLAATGWAVQLLYVGADNTPGTPALMGDDAVAASKAIGDGIAKVGQKPGNFAGSAFSYTYGVTTVGGDAVQQGRQFIIRIFNDANANNATQYFDITAPFALTAADDGGTDTIAITGVVGQTPGDWQPVPEPTSFALLGLGVAALALRRRVR